MSYLEAHAGFFTLLMKGIFDPYVDFKYSEKAIKFCKIFNLFLTVCTAVKSKVKISQNFVAFSEYMNFIGTLCLQILLRVPVRVIYNASVCCRQVDTQASSSGTQQENFQIRFFEKSLNIYLTLF